MTFLGKSQLVNGLHMVYTQVTCKFRNLLINKFSSVMTVIWILYTYRKIIPTDR